MQNPISHNSSMPTSPKTLDQYNEVIRRARRIFEDKVADYGCSWRVLRLISIIDQLYIKAWRIRQIQETGEQRIADTIESEYIGIINYGYIGRIQIQEGDSGEADWSLDQALQAYDGQVKEVTGLMLNKNHDYGEAWRAMSLPGFTDLILVKLLRIKQILQNKGITKVSEGPAPNLADIVNYAIFASIRLQEEAEKAPSHHPKP